MRYILLPSLKLNTLGYSRSPKRLSVYLRDEFASGNLVSPRQAEVGSWTIVDTTTKLSLASGVLNQSNAAGSANGNDPLMWSAPIVRKAGIIMLFRVRFQSGNNVAMRIGYEATQPTTGTNNTVFIRDTILFISTNVGAESYRFIQNAGLAQEITPVGSIQPNTYYYFAIILRASGAFLAIKGGVYTKWTMLTPARNYTASPLWPAMARTLSTQRATTDVDFIRIVRWSRSIWNTDHGIMTNTFSGLVTNGQTFTHEANTNISWICTSLPTGITSQVVDFRKQDDDNKWQVVVNSDGSLTLYEVVATIATARGAFGAGSVVAGSLITVIAYGASIRMFATGVAGSPVNYTSATNFQTLTAGQVSALGTGTMSDLEISPRELTGEAAADLDTIISAF